MLLLALGLPLVMTFAWYHGERASRQVSKAEMMIISILLVIGSLLFYAFVQPSAEVAAGSKPVAQQASVAAARSASLNPATAISIAVLPFENLSADPEQEFFSAGMSEEITALSAWPRALRQEDLAAGRDADYPAAFANAAGESGSATPKSAGREEPGTAPFSNARGSLNRRLTPSPHPLRQRRRETSACASVICRHRSGAGVVHCEIEYCSAM